MTWPVPSPRLAVVLVAAGVLLVLMPDIGRTAVLGVDLDNRFLVVNTTALLAAVIDLALAPSPGRLSVERRHPTSVVLDTSAPIEWAVSQQTGRAGPVWVADDLAPSLGAPTRRVRIEVPSAGVGVVRSELHPVRRGRFRPSELVVRTAGPLRLVHKHRKRDVPTDLWVLPPFRSAREAELSLRKARILEVGLRSARGRGGGTDFDSLRELTPDDETKRIDWAATARTSRPIVRTYRAERNQTVLCLLDAGRVMAGRVDGIPRFEYGMDGAMLLAQLATGLGDRMGLVSFDRTVHTTVEPSARRSQRSVVTNAVFDLEPALAESDYRGAITHVMARYRKRLLLVLITELVEEVADLFLLPALAPLMTRHLVIVGAVRDPDVERWTTTTTTDEDGGFLRAASLAAIESRRRVAAKLRARGAIVVDEAPSAFATALGDAYLEAKAVGRL